jgi:hypothetical protein
MELGNLTETIQLFSAFLIAFTSFAATLVGIIRPLRKWFVEKFTNKNEMGNRITAIENNIVQINQFITSLKDDLYSKFETDRNEQRIMKEATIASIRNALTAIYNRANELGYISDYDKENFEKLYLVYTELGGNSYVHIIHDQIMKMPNKPVSAKRSAKGKKKSGTRG